jgi:hypothetical protein
LNDDGAQQGVGLKSDREILKEICPTFYQGEEDQYGQAEDQETNPTLDIAFLSPHDHPPS